MIRASLVGEHFSCSLVLMIVMKDAVALMKGEIKCWSLLGFKGLIIRRMSYLQ